ncbi:uncharacterized protein K460DRAFT_417462 [Cucurbitaria berberidis CBS 394.84]|uniref:Uncharacterized protein n=1 Tax=Cucurbitaria berberidis CBS 394.84 TaxID=1168544 RepID=A0A9P4GJ52_9PLEO|nr:uncharacterized protein K460DRAFT_417462 [Cucurbitaria berberidis CBS 394.84]KAF1846361.1 hypothetical protein K460DRAFT_417462 [Cucurbitaria berberidis CBS 394.84]
MRFLTIIMSLTAAASAADIRLRFEGGCKGGFAVCSNIAARTCCNGERGTQGTPSLGFVNMPHNAAVGGWQATRNGQICGALVASGNTGNGNNACLNPPAGGSRFAGGTWNPSSKKRYAVNEDILECTNSQVADALVLADGKKYNVKGMEEGLVTELYTMVWNGTVKEDVPEVYATFEALE